MAKYTVTYRCGHTEEMQLFGKESERQRRIDHYRTVDCPACRAASATREAEAAGLPFLRGSDKQKAWASEIRSTSLRFIGELRKMTKAGQEGAVDKMVKGLLAEDSAAFWIDNRTDLSSDVVSLARFVYDNYNR